MFLARLRHLRSTLLCAVERNSSVRRVSCEYPMPMLNAAGKTYEKIIEHGLRRSQIVAGFVQVFQKFALEFDQGIRYANEPVRRCQVFYRNPIGQRLHGGPPRL